jgi:hypothetical protein
MLSMPQPLSQFKISTSKIPLKNVGIIIIIILKKMMKKKGRERERERANQGIEREN